MSEGLARFSKTLFLERSKEFLKRGGEIKKNEEKRGGHRSREGKGGNVKGLTEEPQSRKRRGVQCDILPGEDPRLDLDFGEEKSAQKAEKRQ